MLDVAQESFKISRSRAVLHNGRISISPIMSWLLSMANSLGDERCQIATKTMIRRYPPVMSSVESSVTVAHSRAIELLPSHAIRKNRYRVTLTVYGIAKIRHW